MKVLCSAILAGLLPLGSAAALVIQEDLKDWYAAAQTGRADVLIIGDSVVLHAGHGWDAGVQAGLGQTIGLAAGTGYLVGRSAGQGGGYGAGGTFGAAWSSSSTAAYG